ncbi:hypothetical protein CAOG_05572 [Capsaspora owczarzaki ATCC 30864]|uniref:Uncharacterized protein n=1 Tax=Capsaspora owczarzaki (strain ATCC 30864) TaxID=595528 RepID=A0A0D2WSG0_CAPO3|nr:hypothetical protein CAOG_05572 [Capsaspora owczarzaki ATCC 30864]KJE95080.1 hypothetical protein CAOG_005572 [Capsaspora owczarzaki ATCC 30864]|eukprot:XP_004346245.1 hypothetical protein CAOG_05572 [Capsaspora owczarzaki ATCC 30864]
MRAFVCLALLALAASSLAAHSPEQLLSQGYESQKTFRDKQVFHHAGKGHTVVIDHVEQIAPKSQGELFDSMMPHHENRMKRINKRAEELGNPYAPDLYWGWIPIYINSLNMNQTITFAGGCFAVNTLSMVYDQTAGSATMTLTSSKPLNTFCEDYYFFATVTSWHGQIVKAAGVQVIEWEKFSPAELEDIGRNGFRVFRFLQNEVETLVDIYETLQLFLGALGLNTGGNSSTHVPTQTAENNLKFLHDYANLTMVPRTTIEVPLDPSEIESGDFIGIVRLDGLDPTIMWGSGSALGHTTVALWIDGELNICESQSKSNYWPVNLVQCNPYADWIKYATAADYNVIHLPLSPEKRAQFNETAAIAFVKSVVGNLYGFQNMLFTWLDTPDQNMPAPVDQHYLVVMLSLLDPILEPLLVELHTPSLWNVAFNRRLGTAYTRCVEIFAHAAAHNVSFGQLISMPEQDWWIYAGHEPWYPDGIAMVCDVFVCYTYKAGGLFGNLTDSINCAEFTPLDVYELAWFDTAPIPAKCQAADPGNKWCQILGKYRIQLPEFNTVQPFAHMRENCPSMPPYADRYNPIAKATC